MRLACFSIALCVGCAPTLQRADLRQLQLRAAFDLGCPPAALSLYSFDESAGGLQNKGVFGCGQRAAYVERCDDHVGSCTWLRDDRGGSQALGAQASPALAPEKGAASRQPALEPVRPAPPTGAAPAPTARDAIDRDIREWGRK